MIHLVQWFNEFVLVPTAIPLDIIARSIRALFFGFRAGAIEAGADLPTASTIAGLIVSAISLCLLWGAMRLFRAVRLQTPGHTTRRAGAVAGALGVLVGVYFLGLAFYISAMPDAPTQLVVMSAGTAAFYSTLGLVARYVLSGTATQTAPSTNRPCSPLP